MNSIPGWLIVVIIIALIVAPAALSDVVSELWNGLQTAFGGFAG